MSFLGQYFLSVFCAASICTILKSLAKGHAYEKPLTILCSLFLSFTMVSPLVRSRLPDMIQIPFSYSAEAEDAATIGTAQTNEAFAEIISDQVRAYILSKAKELHLPVQVAVHLNDALPPKPIGVTITGQIPEKEKEKLIQILETELKIPKEHQIWIQSNYIEP